MGILARKGGLSPFCSSALPHCTHRPMQLFIFSYWGCSIHWLSHLLCSIGVRQHLFEERNVAFHWWSSKNAAETIKNLPSKRYSWAWGWSALIQTIKTDRILCCHEYICTSPWHKVKNNADSQKVEVINSLPFLNWNSQNNKHSLVRHGLSSSQYPHPKKKTTKKHFCNELDQRVTSLLQSVLC